MAVRSVPSVEWQRGFAACQEAVIALCKDLHGEYQARDTRDDACRAGGVSQVIVQIRALSPRRGP